MDEKHNGHAGPQVQAGGAETSGKRSGDTGRNPLLERISSPSEFCEETYEGAGDENDLESEEGRDWASDAESVEDTLAEFKEGEIDRATMIRTVIEIVAPWDVRSRSSRYERAEAKLGEHVCEWWSECEGRHEVAVDRYWLRPLGQRGREYAPAAVRLQLARKAAELTKRIANPERRQSRTGEPQPQDARRRAPTEEEMISTAVAACKSAEEFSKTKSPELEWAIPGFLVYGALHDLHGNPKDGKSTLVAWWIRALVNGEAFLGESVPKTGAVWITEQPRATHDRLLQQAGLYEHPDLYLMRMNDLQGVSWSATAKAAVKVAAEKDARVLVIDTFTRCAGLRGDDENSAGAVLEALDALHPATSANMAVILVRHDRKSGGDPISAARGSNAVVGEVDIILHLTHPKGQPENARTIECRGRLADLMPAKRVLTLEGGGFQELNVVVPDEAARHRMRTLARWRELAPVVPLEGSTNGETTGLTAEEIGEQVGKQGRIIRGILNPMRALEQSDKPPGELRWRGGGGRQPMRYFRPTLKQD